MARIQYIDRLKGMAIILVVIGHLMAFCTVSVWNPINEVIMSFHMPLFMFLSGIVATPPQCLRKLSLKFSRFMLPMLWVGLLFSAVVVRNVPSFFTDHYKNGYWYLYVLTLYYVVLYLYGKFPVPKRFVWIADIGLLIVVHIASSLLDRAISPSLSDTLGAGMFKGYWVYFCLGFIVRRHNLMAWIVTHNWIFTLALLSYVPLLYLFETHVFVRFGQLVPISIIIVLLYLFRAREHQTAWWDRGLAYIGRSTLDIYVFHYFVLNVINLRAVSPWLQQSGNYLLELLLLVVIALLVCGVCILIGKVLRQSDIIRMVVFGDTAWMSSNNSNNINK